MATEAKGNKQVEAELADAEAESIDQVRDILFGAQMRTVERRMAQLEARFQRELDSSTKSLTQKIEALDAGLKKQGETLNERLKAERAKRTEDLKALGADMKSGFKDLDKRLADLDNATSKADAELRDQMMALGKSLSEDIQALSDRLTADIDRYTTELRNEKTDLSALIELYSDMARRLAGILEAPGD